MCHLRYCATPSGSSKSSSSTPRFLRFSLSLEYSHRKSKPQTLTLTNTTPDVKRCELSVELRCVRILRHFSSVGSTWMSPPARTKPTPAPCPLQPLPPFHDPDADTMATHRLLMKEVHWAADVVFFTGGPQAHIFLCSSSKRVCPHGLPKGQGSGRSDGCCFRKDAHL